MWKDSWFSVKPEFNKAEPEGFTEWWLKSDKSLDKLNLARDCWEKAFETGFLEGHKKGLFLNK